MRPEGPTSAVQRSRLLLRRFVLLCHEPPVLRQQLFVKVDVGDAGKQTVDKADSRKNAAGKLGGAEAPNRAPVSPRPEQPRRRALPTNASSARPQYWAAAPVSRTGKQNILLIHYFSSP